MAASKPPPKTNDRDAKLASALRANLRRRKAGVAAGGKPAPPKPGPKS